MYHILATRITVGGEGQGFPYGSGKWGGGIKNFSGGGGGICCGEGTKWDHVCGPKNTMKTPM